MHKYLLTAAALATLTTPAFAQGFSGGELTIDAYALEEGDSSVNVNYSIALEYAITRDISFAGDLSVNDFSVIDDNVTTFTIHSIYHLSDQASTGVFVGNNFSDGNGSTFYGLEVGYETGAFAGEASVALYDTDDTPLVFTLAGDYDLNAQVSLIGDLGVADFDDGRLTRISAGAEYTFAAGPKVHAELGNISADGGDSSFIGIGATLEFGAARGTTFDRRGVFDAVLPGF